MTGILLAGGLALLVAVALLAVLRPGRSGWEPIVAALLVGLAGYAWQGRPALSGQPAASRTDAMARIDEGLIERRQLLSVKYGPGARWLILSDGLARQGNSRDAANVLVSALRAYPRDPDLWVGLGNALLLHANGVLSPSAEYAYRQAMRLAPDRPAARYFYGLALAQSGKLGPARALWTELAADLPEAMPFRQEVERNIMTVDSLLARQARAPGLP